MGPKLKIIKPNVIRRRRPKIHKMLYNRKGQKQYKTERDARCEKKKKENGVDETCTSIPKGERGNGSNQQTRAGHNHINAMPTKTTENKIKEINTHRKLTVNAII